MKKIDTIIVGGGIVGLTYAYQLFKKKKSFLLIDSGSNYSSTIAAGIINPVVFRRMALSWEVETCLPKAINFYKELEHILNKKFFFPIDFRRVFAHQQEKDIWNEKIKELTHQNYLDEINQDDLDFNIKSNTCGTGRIKQAYWVDSKSLIAYFHAFLIKENQLIYENFKYSKINHQDKTYGSYAFDHIVFCEGFHVKDNPLFTYVPVQSTKGEVLTIETTNFTTQELLNYKCFMLPLGENQYKIGSNYEWNNPDFNPSEKGKNEILNNFNKLVDTNFFVTKHEAGIRPTVLDRRPVLGSHATNQHCYILNGFGAKGYLLAPHFSEYLFDFVYNNKKIDKEISIERFNT